MRIFRNKKFIVLLALFVVAYSHSFGQRIIINGEETKRNLNWNDFTGTIDASSSHSAYTYYHLNYSMDAINFENGKASIVNLIVTLELNNQKCWAKPQNQTDELLVHEQGHFNIGILCMYEIIERFNSAKIDKHNSSWLLQRTFNEMIEKYAELHLKYDKETEHSANADKQIEWNNYFVENLKKINHKQ